MLDTSYLTRAKTRPVVGRVVGVVALALSFSVASCVSILVRKRRLLLYNIGRYSLVSSFPRGCRRIRKFVGSLISVSAIGITPWGPGPVPRGSRVAAFVVWVR